MKELLLVLLLTACAKPPEQQAQPDDCTAVGKPTQYMFGHRYHQSQLYNCGTDCTRIVSLETAEQIDICGIPQYGEQ